MSRKNNRIIHSPTVERLLLEIEGQAVKSQPKSFVQPRNYTKENIKRLKEIQEKCKRREVNPSTPTKALPLKPIYNGKIKPNNPITNGNLTSPKVLYQSKQPKGDTDLSIASYRLHGLRKSSSQQNVNESQPTRPTSSNIKKSPSLTDLKNHRKEPLKVAPSLPHSLGTVPKYLIRRKQQWKEEEEKKREAMNKDATIPPGHTLMSDKERIETLQLLIKTQNSLLQQLIALPVQIDTMRTKQRKEDIENQLKKAEEGINIFSRSRVLIKNDS